MCRMVYFASNETLPLIEWNQNHPAFNVSALTPEEQRVTKQFTKSNVVYLGAYTGCGCGFACEMNDDELVQESLNALRVYLRQAISTSREVELFACWAGNEEEKPARRLVLTVQELNSDLLGDVEPAWFATVH